MVVLPHPESITPKPGELTNMISEVTGGEDADVKEGKGDGEDNIRSARFCRSKVRVSNILDWQRRNVQ